MLLKVASKLTVVRGQGYSIEHISRIYGKYGKIQIFRFLGFSTILVIFNFYIRFFRPRRHLESFLEPVASFSQSMSPWRAMATPFMAEII